MNFIDYLNTLDNSIRVRLGVDYFKSNVKTISFDYVAFDGL
jgi:hypothetical protein